MDRTTQQLALKVSLRTTEANESLNAVLLPPPVNPQDAIKQKEAELRLVKTPTSFGERLPVPLSEISGTSLDAFRFNRASSTTSGRLRATLSSDGVQITGSLVGNIKSDVTVGTTVNDTLVGFQGTSNITRLSGTVTESIGNQFVFTVSGTCLFSGTTEIIGDTVGTVFNEVFGSTSIVGNLEHLLGDPRILTLTGPLTGAITPQVQGIISNNGTGVCGAYLLGACAARVVMAGTHEFTGIIEGSLDAVQESTANLFISIDSIASSTSGSIALTINSVTNGTITSSPSRIISGSAQGVQAGVNLNSEGVISGVGNLTTRIVVNTSFKDNGFEGTLFTPVQDNSGIPGIPIVMSPQINGLLKSVTDGVLVPYSELDSNFFGTASDKVIDAVDRARSRFDL